MVGIKLQVMKCELYALYYDDRLLTSLRWLYGMNIAIDANFRLKLKARGVIDPEFGSGWSYFVDDEKYKAEIAKHPQPIEVRIFDFRFLTILNFPLEK